MKLKLTLPVLVLLIISAGCLGATDNLDDRDDIEPPVEKPNDPDENISMEKFNVKVSLLEEFRVGTNAGMPTIVSEEMIDATIEDNSQLAQQIREEFTISSEGELYTKVQQFNRIYVEESGDRYEFTIRSGETCTIRTIDGTYDPETDNITVEEEETENVPC